MTMGRDAGDRIDQIRRNVEWEMMEKEIARLWLGPAESVVYYFKAEPWLRMSKHAAEAKIRSEALMGVRHKLRTKDAILAFLNEHGIPYEVIDHDAELYARVDAEAHKRMRAAALNRRRHGARADRAFW